MNTSSSVSSHSITPSSHYKANARENLIPPKSRMNPGIEPYAWVLNKSILAAGTRDRLLSARLAGEKKQIDRMSGGLAARTFIVPWQTRPPIGFSELSRLVTDLVPQ